MKWNPDVFVDVEVERWASRKTKRTVTKRPKPSQNIAEGVFDALTSYKQFLLTPFLETPSI